MLNSNHTAGWPASAEGSLTQQLGLDPAVQQTFDFSNPDEAPQPKMVSLPTWPGYVGHQRHGDGLYIQAELTDRGEQVLRDNPYLGVSARIVENYNRSDGKFYKAAVQHVLGTLDPRLPGLVSLD